MKYLFALITICSMLFIAGCSSMNNQESLNAPISDQRIQELQKNDNYIPWWKR